MTVRAYRLILRKETRVRGAKTTELDPESDTRLREILTEWTEEEHAGPKVRDYSQWSLSVHEHKPANPGQAGNRVARVTVDQAGRTVVKRP